VSGVDGKLKTVELPKNKKIEFKIWRLFNEAEKYFHLNKENAVET